MAHSQKTSLLRSSDCMRLRLQEEKKKKKNRRKKNKRRRSSLPRPFRPQQPISVKHFLSTSLATVHKEQHVEVTLIDHTRQRVIILSPKITTEIQSLITVRLTLTSRWDDVYLKKHLRESCCPAGKLGTEMTLFYQIINLPPITKEISP